MTKNKKGGNRNRRQGRKFFKPASRDTILKETNQEYGLLQRNLGDCRFECLCNDKKIRIAHVPGSFRKRIWMRVDDFVLVSIRTDLDPMHCDILHKYMKNEVDQLTEKGFIDNLLLKEIPDPEDIIVEEEVVENNGFTINIQESDDDNVNDIIASI
jgi:translation initiation factor 1A